MPPIQCAAAVPSYEVQRQRHGREAQHTLASGPQLAQVQRQPTLEHDNRHG